MLLSMWLLISVTSGYFCSLFMNEVKNLTNVVIGKLGKLVHKQNGNMTTT